MLTVNEKPKRKTGRPLGTLKVNPSDAALINQAKRLAELGLTNEQISYIIGVGTSTLRRYKSNDPVFSAAISKGRAEGLAKSSTALMQKVEEGDVAAIKWYETTRHGMSEKSKVESDVTVRAETIEEWLAKQKGIEYVGSNGMGQIHERENTEVQAIDVHDTGSSADGSKCGSGEESV
jgi:hypothetical protein